MNDSPIFLNPSSDPEMERASTEARRSFRVFWREVSWERRRIVPGLRVAAVKACLSDPPEASNREADALGAEHVWLSDVDFDGRVVKGVLLNRPHSLKSFSMGDPVAIGPKQISDWIYVADDEVCGGFTVDVLRSRMSKGQRKQHDSAWGLDFGAVGVVQLVPWHYLGINPKKGWLSRSPTTEAQSIQQASTIEHPMSVNMRQSLDDALTHDPEMLTQEDDHGYTFLHQLALAGSVDGVEVCLEHGANPCATAKNGMTPYLLAKSLGWSKVMKLLADP